VKRQPRSFESGLASSFQDFVRHHRALGKRFDTEERALCLFDHYLVEQNIHQLSDIRGELLETFLKSRRRPVAKSYNHLLGVLRRWFDWLVRQQRLAKSPLGLQPRRMTSARNPFLFNVDQARQLLALAAQLPDNNRGRQRGLVYSTIFALLYGLGLRVGEVTRVRLNDVDWERNVLTIRKTKFAKTRLVPLGPKLAARLQDYRNQHEKLWGSLTDTDPLFSFGPEKSRPVNPSMISQTFHRIWPHLNLPIPAGVAPPRLHCLRHSFSWDTPAHPQLRFI